jgi:hypothetical protein
LKRKLEKLTHKHDFDGARTIEDQIRALEPLLQEQKQLEQQLSNAIMIQSSDYLVAVKQLSSALERVEGEIERVKNLQGQHNEGEGEGSTTSQQKGSRREALDSCSSCTFSSTTTSEPQDPQLLEELQRAIDAAADANDFDEAELLEGFRKEFSRILDLLSTTGQGKAKARSEKRFTDAKALHLAYESYMQEFESTKQQIMAKLSVQQSSLTCSLLSLQQTSAETCSEAAAPDTVFAFPTPDSCSAASGDSLLIGAGTGSANPPYINLAEFQRFLMNSSTETLPRTAIMQQLPLLSDEDIDNNWLQELGSQYSSGEKQWPGADIRVCQSLLTKPTVPTIVEALQSEHQKLQNYFHAALAVTQLHGEGVSSAMQLRTDIARHCGLFIHALSYINQRKSKIIATGVPPSDFLRLFLVAMRTLLVDVQFENPQQPALLHINVSCASVMLQSNANSTILAAIATYSLELGAEVHMNALTVMYILTLVFKEKVQQHSSPFFIDSLFRQGSIFRCLEMYCIMDAKRDPCLAILTCALLSEVANRNPELEHYSHVMPALAVVLERYQDDIGVATMVASFALTLCQKATWRGQLPHVRNVRGLMQTNLLSTLATIASTRYSGNKTLEYLLEGLRRDVETGPG